jgi:hypothetical protein
MPANVSIQVENEKSRVGSAFSLSAGENLTFKLGGVQFTVGREAVEAKALKLEVGKWYKQRAGGTVQIVRLAKDAVFTPRRR